VRISPRTSRRARLLAACAALAAAAASATGCARARVEGPQPAGRLFPIYEGDKLGYIDRTGRIVISPNYPLSLPADFVEGRAMVVIPESPGRTGGGAKGEGRPYRVGFIDATGRMVIEPVYDDAKLFSEGLAVVGRNGKYGYVDPRGSVRIPLQFDRAQSFSEGLAQVRDAAGVRFRRARPRVTTRNS